MILILITSLVLLITAYTLIKPKNYPPGPKWIPFIGCSNVIQNMTKEYGSQLKGFSQLAKMYSTKVLGLKIGRNLVVVVFGEKNLKKVFTGTEFEGRPDNFFTRLRSFGKIAGITFSDGPMWREHRHFTVKHLKNVGFGKTQMEKEIQLELLSIIEHIKNIGNPVNPKKILAPAVMDVLWKYVAGEKIAEDRLKHLLELLNARSKSFNMLGGWLGSMPWLRFFFPKISGYQLILTMNEQLSTIIEDAIEKHKNKKVAGNDFIYYYLEEMNKNKEFYTEDQLKAICLDLLIAGSQTTSNSLEFAILVVLRNKTIQDKIFAEIYQVLGNKTPGWGDVSRLPYTYAFLLEVQRYYTIVPLAGPRRVLESTTIDGYNIPKETTVLMAVEDMHFDPEIWKDPNEFRPERFIDGSGNIKNSEHLYVFGLGRRRCPGDSLARSFIFIVFVGLLQKYKVECSNGLIPSDEPVIGILSAPRDFIADFVPRQ